MIPKEAARYVVAEINAAELPNELLDIGAGGQVTRPFAIVLLQAETVADEDHHAMPWTLRRDRRMWVRRTSGRPGHPPSRPTPSAAGGAIIQAPRSRAADSRGLYDQADWR